MKRSPSIHISLPSVCDGHAGITAATAAAGTGGLLLLLVFPEKKRVIFQCLHILLQPRKIFPKFASMDDLSSLLYSFSSLPSDWVSSRNAAPVLAQDGRQLLEVTHLEGGHLVQDKYKGTLFSMEKTSAMRYSLPWR